MLRALLLLSELLGGEVLLLHVQLEMVGVLEHLGADPTVVRDPAVLHVYVNLQGLLRLEGLPALWALVYGRR